MRQTFEQRLARHIRGDVSLEFETRRAFAVDESIFTLLPRCVVFPKDEKDLQTLVAFCAYEGLPLTPRGGGSGVAGQAIGAGVIVDTRRYMNRILHKRGGHVVLQPGVVLADLQRDLARENLRFAPDPGSQRWCTLGGMVATNASGPHSLRWGSTRNHVASLRVVLSDASVFDTTQGSTAFSALSREIQSHRKDIVAAWPRVEKNSSGYDLPSFLSESTLAHGVFCGSEGTLGLISEITVRVIERPRFTTLAIFLYPSAEAAARAVADMRALSPAAIELLDDYVLRALFQTNEALLREKGLSPEGASLWVEWEDELPDLRSLDAVALIHDEAERLHLWSLRSKVSKLLHHMAGERKPLRCIEDACVPLNVLPQFVCGLDVLLEKHDARGPRFGHIGQGHLHVNPWVDVQAPRLRERLEALMHEYYSYVLSLGGTISGEHGDGLLRAPYARKQWQHLWPLMLKVKQHLDPLNLMNPGKKIPVRSAVSVPYKDLVHAWVGATDQGTLGASVGANAVLPTPTRPQPLVGTTLGSPSSSIRSTLLSAR